MADNGVFLEMDAATGNIIALHRIDYSEELRRGGRVTTDRPGRAVEDVTAELSGGRLPEGVASDKDLVDNYRRRNGRFEAKQV